jgi:hypothetical protein
MFGLVPGGRNLVVGAFGAADVTLEKIQCLGDREWLKASVLDFEACRLNVEARSAWYRHPLDVVVNPKSPILSGAGALRPASSVWVAPP